MDSVELIARTICIGCEEQPDHQGDARGNDYRWQDYRSVAVMVLDVIHGTPCEQIRHQHEVELLKDALCRAKRLLSVCTFDDEADLEDLNFIDDCET